MTLNDPSLWFIVALGSAAAAAAVLSGIGSHSHAAAQQTIDASRNHQKRLREEALAAEQVGRAAAVEPLATNPDGSIAQPILAAVERR